MGIDGEHDHVGWAGWIGAKQIAQSGYGGVLRSWINLDVRSSAFGADVLYFSEVV